MLRWLVAVATVVVRSASCDAVNDGTGVVLDSQTVAIAGKRYGIQDDESAGACVAQQQDERCSVWRASGALVEALRQPDHGAACSVVPPRGVQCT